MAGEHDRLNGWKEIAAFLGKGVRTVQRWERDYDLPIHRQGPTGELIFAFRSELEAWVRAGIHRERPEGAYPSESASSPDADAGAAAHATPDGTGAPALPTGGPLFESVTAPAGATVEDVSDASELPRRFPLPLTWVAAGSAVAIVSLGFWRESRSTETGEPAQWDVSGNALHVSDASGATLWSHRFGFELTGRIAARLPAGVDVP
jgi:hypothetical protein